MIVMNAGEETGYENYSNYADYGAVFKRNSTTCGTNNYLRYLKGREVKLSESQVMYIQSLLIDWGRKYKKVNNILAPCGVDGAFGPTSRKVMRDTQIFFKDPRKDGSITPHTIYSILKYIGRLRGRDLEIARDISLVLSPMPTTPRIEQKVEEEQTVPPRQTYTFTAPPVIEAPPLRPLTTDITALPQRRGEDALAQELVQEKKEQEILIKKKQEEEKKVKVLGFLPPILKDQSKTLNTALYAAIFLVGTTSLYAIISRARRPARRPEIIYYQ